MSEYPEHEKMQKVQHHSQAAGEFIEWLEENDHFIVEWVCSEEHLGGGFFREPRPLESLLARWLGIDLDKIEQEKRDMLAKIREERG